MTQNSASKSTCWISIFASSLVRLSVNVFSDLATCLPKISSRSSSGWRFLLLAFSSITSDLVSTSVSRSFACFCCGSVPGIAIFSSLIHPPLRLPRLMYFALCSQFHPGYLEGLLVLVLSWQGRCYLSETLVKWTTSMMVCKSLQSLNHLLWRISFSPLLSQIGFWDFSSLFWCHLLQFYSNISGLFSLQVQFLLVCDYQIRI